MGPQFCFDLHIYLVITDDTNHRAGDFETTLSNSMWSGAFKTWCGAKNFWGRFEKRPFLFEKIPKIVKKIPPSKLLKI